MSTEGAAAAPRWRRIGVPAVAIALIVVGIALIAQHQWALAHVSFGWFAYAPLSHSTFVPDLGFDWAPLGLALVGVGMGALAVLAGRRVEAARGFGGRRLGARLLRSSPWLGGGAVAVVAGAVLVHWNATRLLLGWRDEGPRGLGAEFVATKSQFDAAMIGAWHSPLVVGVALLLLGIAALGFAAGRLSTSTAADAVAP